MCSTFKVQLVLAFAGRHAGGSDGQIYDFYDRARVDYKFCTRGEVSGALPLLDLDPAQQQSVSKSTRIFVMLTLLHHCLAGREGISPHSARLLIGT